MQPILGPIVADDRLSRQPKGVLDVALEIAVPTRTDHQHAQPAFVDLRQPHQVQVRRIDPSRQGQRGRTVQRGRLERRDQQQWPVGRRSRDGERAEQHQLHQAQAAGPVLHDVPGAEGQLFERSCPCDRSGGAVPDTVVIRAAAAVRTTRFDPSRQAGWQHLFRSTILRRVAGEAKGRGIQGERAVAAGSRLHGRQPLDDFRSCSAPTRETSTSVSHRQAGAARDVAAQVVRSRMRMAPWRVVV